MTDQLAADQAEASLRETFARLGQIIEEQVEPGERKAAVRQMLASYGLLTDSERMADFLVGVFTEAHWHRLTRDLHDQYLVARDALRTADQIATSEEIDYAPLPTGDVAVALREHTDTKNTTALVPVDLLRRAAELLDEPRDGSGAL